MTQEIISLPIDDLVPDPNQPRRYFDREALERLKGALLSVGQLNPIRVRRVDGRWMIVDGQRRWLAMTALRKQYPADARFASINAYVGGDLDEESSSRRVVQVLSNVSADLTPSEKAEVLQELLQEEAKLSIDEAAQRLGLAKGQALFLRQLASAPAFIRELGRGADGAALPLWNLVTLVRLYRKLRKWDDEQFRESEGQHQRIADREVRALGERAREQGLGKRKLEAEAERVFARVTGAKEEKAERDPLASIRKSLGRVEELGDEQRAQVVELLEDALERLGVRTSREAKGRTKAPAN